MPDIIMGSASIYGIVVTSGSFRAACQAFKAIMDQIRFLDLILLRRRRGSLRSNSPTSHISDVPGEIWIKIRRELFDGELEHQEEEYGERLLCQGCIDDNLDSDGHYLTFDEVEELRAGCSDCPEEYYPGEKPKEEVCDVSDLLQRGIGKDSLPLLERFGIYSPLEDATSNYLADRRTYDLDYDQALFIIAAAPLSEQDNDWGGEKLFSDDDEHRIAYHQFEVINLRLPSNVDNRFRQLVSFARLVVMDRDPATGPSDELSPITRNVEPKWMKWTYAHEEQ